MPETLEVRWRVADANLDRPFVQCRSASRRGERLAADVAHRLVGSKSGHLGRSGHGANRAGYPADRRSRHGVRPGRQSGRVSVRRHDGSGWRRACRAGPVDLQRPQRIVVRRQSSTLRPAGSRIRRPAVADNAPIEPAPPQPWPADRSARSGFGLPVDNSAAERSSDYLRRRRLRPRRHDGVGIPDARDRGSTAGQRSASAASPAIRATGSRFGRCRSAAPIVPADATTRLAESAARCRRDPACKTRQLAHLCAGIRIGGGWTAGRGQGGTVGHARRRPNVAELRGRR